MRVNPPGVQLTKAFDVVLAYAGWLIEIGMALLSVLSPQPILCK
jgi:hypothetical protein